MTKQSDPIPAVIFSGGAEIVSLALAHSLLSREIPLVVFSLGKPSLLKSLPGVIHHEQMDWPPRDPAATVGSIRNLLQSLSVGRPTFPWPAFATEDGGLRLLIENRSELSSYLQIGGSPQLKFGGLDKAELFRFLSNAGLDHLLAETQVLDNPDQLPSMFQRFSDTGLVVKPALKPLSMDLSTLGAKAIAVRSSRELEHQARRLQTAWPISNRWVAQPLLTAPPQGEAVWYGMRTSSGAMIGLTAYERWKYPPMGGSASWVETREVPGLQAMATEILNSLGFTGVAELAFLQDQNGNWRLIELNPRPWLQSALPETAGLPLLYLAYLDLAGLPCSLPDISPQYGIHWINMERLVLAAMTGAYGNPLKALWQAQQIIRLSHHIAVWSTPLPLVRRRWILRLLSQLSSRSG